MMNEIDSPLNPRYRNLFQGIQRAIKSADIALFGPLSDRETSYKVHCIGELSRAQMAAFDFQSEDARHPTLNNNLDYLLDLINIAYNSLNNRLIRMSAGNSRFLTGGTI